VTSLRGEIAPQQSLRLYRSASGRVNEGLAISPRRRSPRTS